MARILWLNKQRNMTEAQLGGLIQIYGAGVEIRFMTKPASDWQDIAKEGEDCDVLAVDYNVSPEILADLTNEKNNKKPVIKEKIHYVPTGNQVFNTETGKYEYQYIVAHTGWVQLEKIVLKNL